MEDSQPMKKTILSFAILFIISSCAFHHGSISGSGYPTNAENEITGTAYGTSKTTHVLGIGGLGTDAIVLEAKKNLYDNYKLEPGQSFVNFSVDFKRSYFLLFNTTRVVVSADVASFNSSTTPNKKTNTASSALFKEGEDLYMPLSDYHLAKVFVLDYSQLSESKDPKTVTVVYFDAKGRPQVANKSPQNFFRSQSASDEMKKHGLKPGDIIEFRGEAYRNYHPEISNHQRDGNYKGIVKGFNGEFIAVEIISPPIHKNYRVHTNFIVKD